MGPITTGTGQIYLYQIVGRGKSNQELRTLQDWVVRPQLRSVPGVADVNGFGGYEKQYQVRIDPTLLIKYGLTFDEVMKAVEVNNQNVGGGMVRQGTQAMLVQGVGRTTNIEQIKNIQIASKDGVPIRVGDVAEVAIGSEIRRGAVTADGKCAVSASSDRTLKVWDVERGRERHTLAGHTAPIRNVSLSADGKWAVSASSETLKVWDLASGGLLQTLDGQGTDVIAVTPDGRVVTVSDDGTRRVWKLAHPPVLTDVASARVAPTSRCTITRRRSSAWTACSFSPRIITSGTPRNSPKKIFALAWRMPPIVSVDS
jgi:hypothetical protein